MTPEQEAHLSSIIKRVGEFLNDKYRKGQEEHGGNLFDLTARQLLLESINESIDDLTYKLTLLDKLPEETPVERK
jgi:hypothetical protein